VRRLPPFALVLAALALFGVGIGILSAAGNGNSAPRAPMGANPVTIAPPSSRLARDFFGIVSEDSFADRGPYRAATLNRLARQGVGLVRQTFDWAQIERRPGRYDWAAYDGFIGSLAARHMTILPVLLDPPAFRSSAPAKGAQPGMYPPRENSDMAAFAAAAVRRYGHGGSFWRQHPELPRVPVRAWQVWNEPSLPAYWPTGPSPTGYTGLLRAVGDAIKAVDPRAEIVTAGLPESRLGIPFGRFLQGMYDAGARTAFDTLAIHPYARESDGVVGAVDDARRIMDSAGDSSAPIWVTEMGWADAGPRSSFTVGSKGQARRIDSTLTSLVNMRSEVRLRGVVYFGWRDGAPYAPTFKDFWGLHTGLLDRRGNPKPALRVFAATVATLRR
jgi:polysaccharide biosynthesis protein PslG